MILKTTIAAKVIRRGLEHVLRVLEAHLFQYFESDKRRAMESDTISDTVAIAPPWVRISVGTEICAFDIAANILINL